MSSIIQKYGVIDLFCGVGGLSHGFVQSGFDVLAGIDFDHTCKYAFEQNNKAIFLTQDITQTSASQISNLFGKKKKILVGCAPCQPFSLYNHKLSQDLERQKKDSKWKLLYSFADLIEEVEPEVVSMENVPLLANFNNGQVIKDFIKRLEAKKYFVSHYVVNANEYGVPQRRKRLILLASKLGEISLIPPTHPLPSKQVKVKDAIGHLPFVKDGQIIPELPLHRARKLTDLNKRRIQATKEGGFWRDWPEDLKLECHKKESGLSFRSVYGRMKWDDVSPTMTTYCVGLGNGRFGHPEQDRAITLLEAAIFQSFPETYDFINPNVPFSTSNIARQIGNAVPVRLGKVIADSIKLHLEHFDKAN